MSLGLFLIFAASGLSNQLFHTLAAPSAEGGYLLLLLATLAVFAITIGGVMPTPATPRPCVQQKGCDELEYTEGDAVCPRRAFPSGEIDRADDRIIMLRKNRSCIRKDSCETLRLSLFEGGEDTLLHSLGAKPVRQGLGSARML